MTSIQLNLVSGVGERYLVNLQSFSRNYCFIPFFFKQTTLTPSNIIIIIIIVNLAIYHHYSRQYFQLLHHHVMIHRLSFPT